RREAAPGPRPPTPSAASESWGRSDATSARSRDPSPRQPAPTREDSRRGLQRRGTSGAGQPWSPCASASTGTVRLVVVVLEAPWVHASFAQLGPACPAERS